MAKKLIKDHFARPGPGYWDGKCMVCDEPVGLHEGVIKKVIRKIRSKK